MLTAAAAVLTLVPAADGLAGSRLQGYYEMGLAAQRNDGHWELGSYGSNWDGGIPYHYGELGFITSPRDHFEIYTKLRAWSNREDNGMPGADYYHPPWYSAEGHLKIGDRKWESYLFYRQNRFYINDEPLLRLVDDNKLKNDSWNPQAQGVRTDFWDASFLGIKGLGGTLIISDSGSRLPYGDTAYIARLRHKIGTDRLTSGVMYLRKDYDTDPEGLSSNSVYSGDVTFAPAGMVDTGLHLGPINLEQSRWTAETAWSTRPGDEERLGASRLHARAMSFEVRSIMVGDLTVHAWYNDFGENFRDFLSTRFDNSHEYNRIQNHVEAIWLVPKKAITAKISHDHFRRRMVDTPGGGLRPATEWYGEIYAEYVNGFKSRIAYKRWRGYDSAPEVLDFYTYPEWFGEISVENFLAKVRLQARVKDAGTFRQVTVYGFDMQVNLTSHLKGFLRGLNVNAKTEARDTIFAQLSYDLGNGANLYFEYGDPGQSNNLVYTDWFTNEIVDSTKLDRIRLVLSAWF